MVSTWILDQYRGSLRSHLGHTMKQMNNTSLKCDIPTPWDVIISCNVNARHIDIYTKPTASRTSLTPLCHANILSWTSKQNCGCVESDNLEIPCWQEYLSQSMSLQSGWDSWVGSWAHCRMAEGEYGAQKLIGWMLNVEIGWSGSANGQGADQPLDLSCCQTHVSHMFTCMQTSSAKQHNYISHLSSPSMQTFLKQNIDYIIITAN